MPPRIDFTEEQIARMRELREVYRVSYEKIGKMFGCSDVKIHTLLDPDFLARCRRRDAERVRSPKGFRTQKSRHGVDFDFVDIPQSVAVRREQYVNAPHRSPGDAMLGCPPVGFSALDRKLQGAGA